MWAALLLLLLPPCLAALLLGLLAQRLLGSAGNPFARPPPGPPRPLVTDPRVRDRVLRRGELGAVCVCVCICLSVHPSLQARAVLGACCVPCRCNACCV